jgi:hypothetical protein
MIKVLKGGEGSGYNVVYRIDGNNILSGGEGSGYNVAYRLDSSGGSDSAGGGKQKSGGGLALLGTILGFLFIHPIGNIVLGFLWLMHCIFNMAGGFHGLGFYISEGGWGPLLIGVIVMAVGVFRTIRRYRK